MGWPRKKEVARLYRLPGNDYRVYLAHDGTNPDTGEPYSGRYTKFKGRLFFLRWSESKRKQVYDVGELPETYGGKAKRISWNELQASWQQYVKQYLNRVLEMAPDSCCGMFRIGETYTEQTEIPLG